MLLKCISIKFHGNPATGLGFIPGNRRTNVTNLICKFYNFSLRPLLKERCGIALFLIIITVAPRSVCELLCVWFLNEETRYVFIFVVSLRPPNGTERRGRRRRIMCYNGFIMIKFEYVMKVTVAEGQNTSL
jgi:hypothetical protein